MSIEKLTKRLQGNIDFALDNEEDLDAASWNYQEGILITVNEAKLLLDLVKTCSIPDVPRQRFSFEEREPEMNECISLVWENGSDCECIYNGLDKTILPLPTHWYYVD